MHYCLSNKIPSLCTALWFCGLVACERSTPPEENQTTAPSTPTLSKPKPNLGPLGSPPDWSVLDGYQQSIPRAEFERLLTTVYALPGSWITTLNIDNEKVRIRRESIRPLLEEKGAYELKFGTAPGKPPRYWRKRNELPSPADENLPLSGVHIVLDPGHIGGDYAVMEERNFQPETGPPVREGDLTLLTARILRPMLEGLGAKVSLVRKDSNPVTHTRPKDFLAQAREELEAQGLVPSKEPKALKWHSEKLFYRTAEIRARAKLVNESLRPDMVVCLHFNASNTSWTLDGKPNYSTENHLHILINGAYSLDELLLDDQRHEMLSRLLSGAHDEELGLAQSIAASLAQTSGLPPFTYTRGAMPIPNQPYIWARNLLANRLFACPVVFCEPYIMNNEMVAARLQAGDYEGEREILGMLLRSIFQEYASGVAAGLKSYYGARK